MKTCTFWRVFSSVICLGGCQSVNWPQPYGDIHLSRLPSKKRNPPIAEFIKRIKDQHGPAAGQEELESCSETVLWTIADFIVYNKCPDISSSIDTVQQRVKKSSTIVWCRQVGDTSTLGSNCQMGARGSTGSRSRGDYTLTESSSFHQCHPAYNRG